MTEHIISNKIKTPDGTILESNNRHDFKCHIDTLTGLEYCVDGGLSYLRRLGGTDYTELSVTTKDPFEVIRNEFKWGSYGKEGDQPLHYILLKDLTKEHIEAILDTQKHLHQWVVDLFLEELSLREVV